MTIMPGKTTARLIAAASLAAGLVVIEANAANWPQWRGPEYNGSSQEAGLPATWSKTEGLKWTADLPGVSAATPVIWGDHVFMTAAIRDSQSLVVMALDRKTGKELWRDKAGIGFGKDNRSTYAAPSAATDGQLVAFFFGNGDLAVYDFSGKKLWARNLQKDYGQFTFLWTFSTSPLLFDGRLYMQVLQRDVPVSGRGFRDRPNDSYLLALDPKTGQEIFRHIRPSKASQESLEAFSTPIPAVHQGRPELLVVGGDCISGHDPKTGREFWRWGTWNPNRIGHWRLVPSPVAGAGVALACAPKGGPVCAVKLGGRGELPDSWLAWQSQDRNVSSDVSTPLFYQGKFYVLNSDKRILNCVEPATGKVVWSEELSGRSKFEASPTGADGKIYVMNHNGDVCVVQAGDQFKLLATIPMGGGEDDNSLRSSVAVSQGNLFIRTGRKLFCVGK